MEKTARIEKVVWTDQFSVGVKDLDEQHRRLIELINKSIDCQTERSGMETISDVLTDLIRYSIEHLSKEERFMTEFAYPETAQHKAAHDEFRKMNGAFHLKHAEGRPEIIEELIAYLKNWLTNHILLVDKKYQAHFNMKGLR